MGLTSFSEGRCMISADHFTLIGDNYGSNEKAQIVSVYFQTSGLTGEPRRISLGVNCLSSDAEILKGACSCAARRQEKCEHLAVALVHYYR